MSDPIVVTCPHCGATLEIDADAGVVVHHQAPVKATEKLDFDARLQQMEADKRRAADRMAEAFRTERSRERINEERFRKLIEGAKDDDEAGTPQIRDIDLD